MSLTLTLRELGEAFSPNGNTSKTTMKIIGLFWLAAFIVAWRLYPSVLIPNPLAVLQAMKELWLEGIAFEFATSFKLNLEALAISSAISLALAYLTVLPGARYVVLAVSKGRFLGLAGFTFLFTVMFGGGHTLKLTLLVFGMSVFFVTAMASEVAAIPKEQFDHARTLRMSEWRVVGEVVILGKMDAAFEIMRQNAAMGWMMLSMVEGIVKGEGGLGAMLHAQNKHFRMEEVFAIQAMIAMIGVAFDYSIGLARRLVCPWADLTLERR